MSVDREAIEARAQAGLDHLAQVRREQGMDDNPHLQQIHALAESLQNGDLPGDEPEPEE